MKTKYTEDIANAIIRFYSAGHFLNLIGSYSCMPCRDTIQEWRKTYTWFGDAMDNALDAHCESLLMIVHQSMLAAKTITDAKIAEARFRYITWLVSKLQRDKYGEKIDVVVEHKLDLAPLLLKARNRMKEVTIDNTPPLIEADITTS